jgi:hypothetical protein
MATTVTGGAFHVEGPADSASAFYTTSSSLAAITWGSWFGGADLQWTNDATVGTTCDVVVVYDTSGSGVGGVLRLTTSAGATLDVSLSGAADPLAGEGTWKVKTDETGLAVASGVTVSFTLRTTNPGTVYLRAISVIPRAS